MRLLQDDRTSVRNVNRVELKRASDKALTLTVRALSPTYPEDAERELPSPVAPFRGEYIRDKRGRIEKDERGQPIRVLDEQDPKYLADVRETQQLQTVKMIVDALDPAEVQFTISRDGIDPKTYYQAVRQEFTAFGFSIGDLAALVRAVAEVSGIDDGAIRAARADFFDEDTSLSGT